MCVGIAARATFWLVVTQEVASRYSQRKTLTFHIHLRPGSAEWTPLVRSVQYSLPGGIPERNVTEDPPTFDSTFKTTDANGTLSVLVSFDPRMRLPPLSHTVRLSAAKQGKKTNKGQSFEVIFEPALLRAIRAEMLSAQKERDPE